MLLPDLGDIVFARGLGKENRPGVVLRVLSAEGKTPERVYIQFGSKSPPLPSQENRARCIYPGHPYFDVLRLNAETWFNPGAAELVRSNDPRIEVIGPCPLGLVIELKKVAGITW